MGAKSVYALNVIFILILYLMGFTISVIYLASLLFLMYAFTFFFVALPLMIAQKRALAYVLILTSYYPTAYSALVDAGVAPFIFLVNSLFLLLGMALAVPFLYEGQGTKGKVVHGLGVAAVVIFALVSYYIIAAHAYFSSFRAEMVDLSMFSSLFVTASVTTTEAIKSLPIKTPNVVQPTAIQQTQPTSQAYQPNPRAATVIFRGLPPTCRPVIPLRGKVIHPRGYYQGDFTFELPSDVNLTLVNMKCQGTIYIPNVTRVRATVGSVVIVNFTPVIPLQTGPQRPLQSPSVALMKRSLSDWDPQVWANRDLSVYRVEKVIGEGGNGYVLKASYSGTPLAIKVLKLYGGSPEEYFKDLTTEASNLVNLSNHKNIVKIYAINVDSFIIGEILKGRVDLYVTNPPMIVMEYMEGGTLKDLLEDDTFFYSSNWQRNALRAICEVAQALDYVHSQGFVHMDVKPHNIFLSARPRVPTDLDTVTFKLGDLGSAVRVNSRVKQLTPQYSPPDVFYDMLARPYLDIFALGVTGYVILTRRMDRPDVDEMNNAIDCYVRGDMDCVRAQIDSARAKLATWSVNLDPRVDQILQAMMSVDPLRRPTAREVVDMIRSIDPTIC